MHFPASSEDASIAQGVLFNSFEEQANYESKKAELRRLGMEVDDFSSPARVQSNKDAPIEGRASSATAPTGDSPTIATLRRQVDQRESISALINAKSAEESQQYNNIIASLRSEIARKDLVAEDRSATLLAQVEALQSVLDRRHDSDSDAIVKYSEVEEQCKESLSFWREELRRHIEASTKTGEQSLIFIADLRKACEQFAEEQADPLNAVMQRDLAVVKDLMSEATRVKVTLLQGRLRPVLTAESLNKLRLTYAIGPGRVSDEVLSLIADEMRAEINQITEEIQQEQSTYIRKTIGVGTVDAATYCPMYCAQEIDRLHAALRQYSNSRVEMVTATKRHHSSDARAEVSKVRQRCAERRDAEERYLREKVVELTRLVADQRAVTHALRTQLVAAVNDSRPFSSGYPSSSHARSANAASSKARGGGNGSFVRAPMNERSAGRRTSQRAAAHHRSPSQIRSLNTVLSVERTVVEEVPVEELAAIARYGKTQRATDGNFIPLKQQGRPSSTTTGRLRTKPEAAKGADGEPFSAQELATLKELRRLRTKVIGK
jgi:hypothetical protein